MKSTLKDIISQAVKAAYPNIDKPTINIEYAEARFGDFSSNIAFVLSKVVGDNPKEIAGKIANAINSDTKISQNVIESVEVADPGFINLKISIPYLSKKISEIIEAGERFGSSDLGKDLKVNIEFISANPTGPLTLGNGRGGYCGDVLANVFTKYGAEVTREYYLNDRGAQVLALGHSVLKDDEAVYKGAYIDEVASQISSQDPVEVGTSAAKIISEKYIKPTVEKMGIKFDHWFSEKEMFEGGKVSEIITQLEKLGFTYKKEDATWLQTTKFGDDKDRVLIKKEGEYTYFSSDIAYLYDKINRSYNLLFDFWGADHHGYVGRMMAATKIAKQANNWSGEFKIILAQLVRLMSNGQEIKMSKRLGTYVTLDELIDEVGPDVTRFFFLDRSLDTHMDFDLDLAKQHSQQNPVFYVQYAYARIHSILAKFEIRNTKYETNNSNIKILKQPEEIALIKELMKLPELVEEIVGDYEVQKLTFYAREIAQKFHHFYEKCPVIESGDSQLTAARLRLLRATKIVLKNTLDLIGVSSPEKM